MRNSTLVFCAALLICLMAVGSAIAKSGRAHAQSPSATATAAER